MRQLVISQRLTNRDNASFKQYLKEISEIKEFGPHEEAICAEKANRGDRDAINELVSRNLRFVVSVAKQYANTQNSLEDLVNEGNIGFIMAAEKFNPNMGFKFISYAVWWVRQSIMQFIYEHGNMVRLPINKINVIGKVNKAVEQLYHQLDREPTVEEIQAITDFSVEDIKSSYMDNTRCFSIDQKINEDSDTEMIDIIPGETMEDIEGKLNGESLKHEINNVLTTLTDRETQILNMYFGLNGSKELGLKEIGDKLGLTNERVRQIKELALKKLRMYGKSSKLREFLNCKIS